MRNSKKISSSKSSHTCLSGRGWEGQFLDCFPEETRVDPHGPSTGLGEAIRPVGVGRMTSKSAFCRVSGTAGLCQVGSGRKPSLGWGGGGQGILSVRTRMRGNGLQSSSPAWVSGGLSTLARDPSHLRTRGTTQKPTSPTTTGLSKAPVP